MGINIKQTLFFKGRVCSAFILIFFVAAAVAFLTFDLTGSSSKSGNNLLSGPIQNPEKELKRVEAIIGNGNADAKTWQIYAECQTLLKRYYYAAQAHKKVLELDPVNRTSIFEQGRLLALSNQKTELKEYLDDLAIQHATICLDIMNRPELKKFLREKTFDTIYRKAQSQAMD